MSQNKNSSFGDSKTLLAILLSTGAFLVWNQWMKSKYPQLSKPKAQVENKLETTDQQKNLVSEPKAESTQDSQKEDLNTEKIILADKKEELVHFEDETLSFDISSKGMSLKNIQLKKYKDRQGEKIHLGSNEGFLNYETNVIGQRKALDFNVRQVGPMEFSGEAIFAGGKIEKKLTVQPKDYSVKTNIYVTGSDSIPGLVTYISETVLDKKSGGLLSANRFDHQELFVHNGSKENREMVSQEEDMKMPYSQVNATAIGSQYFALGFVNESDLLPNIEFTTDLKNKSAVTKIFYNILNRDQRLNLDYTAYLGPKSLEKLEKVSENLTGVIDFGFFSSISLFMQKILTFFHNYTNNWGVAIILLTLLVRLLVLPTALSSYKSMKNMSKIAPLMKEIREKYKDDPNQRNAATMQLYKEHKVNPIGGCLPMLLQLPVFFALYQVLGVSIDLYQQPFVLWIHDLSIKDPYYVLPVLMGITMFLQQKLTPTTMDPTQAKVMMFMPLFFSFLMASLPSGLTLYIFVSGVFGIFQQLYFMKDKTKEAKQ